MKALGNFRDGSFHWKIKSSIIIRKAKDNFNIRTAHGFVYKESPFFKYYLLIYSDETQTTKEEHILKKDRHQQVVNNHMKTLNIQLHAADIIDLVIATEPSTFSLSLWNISIYMKIFSSASRWWWTLFWVSANFSLLVVTDMCTLGFIEIVIMVAEISHYTDEWCGEWLICDPTQCRECEI